MLNLLSSLRLLNSLKICIQTKVLNTTDLLYSSSQSRKPGALTKCMMRVTVSWKIDWPMIIFHMVVEKRGAPPFGGFRSKICSVGGSVARARAASESLVQLEYISRCEET